MSTNEQRILDLFRPSLDASGEPTAETYFAARLAYGLSASKISKLLDIDVGSVGRLCRSLGKKGLLRPHPYPISDMAKLRDSGLRDVEPVETPRAALPRKLIYSHVAKNEVCYVPTAMAENIATANVIRDSLSKLLKNDTNNFLERLHTMLWRNVCFLGYTMNLKINYSDEFANIARDADLHLKEDLERHPELVERLDN